MVRANSLDPDNLRPAEWSLDSGSPFPSAQLVADPDCRSQPSQTRTATALLPLNASSPAAGQHRKTQSTTQQVHRSPGTFPPQNLATFPSWQLTIAFPPRFLRDVCVSAVCSFTSPGLFH